MNICRTPINQEIYVGDEIFFSPEPIIKALSYITSLHAINVLISPPYTKSRLISYNRMDWDISIKIWHLYDATMELKMDE